MTEAVCPTCHGSGKKIEKPCKSCHGEGRVHKKKNLSVKIPAGVDTGNQLRLSGEGAAGEMVLQQVIYMWSFTLKNTYL